MYLSEIWIYPIKGLGGLALSEAPVERRGLRYDRRWMLVDDQGVFVTQREIAAMTHLGMAIEGAFLVAYLKNKPKERVYMPLAPPVGDLKKMEVRIWDDSCEACAMPDDLNAWFSEQLGHSLRLVYMHDNSHRPADPTYAPAGHPVSFADGFPFLVIGQSSLDALNVRLAQPVPMNRFRPNFVFTGGLPHEEDQWQDFSIGAIPFRGVKPCARCIVPTTDQDSGLRGAEPLKTLATYRQQGHKILFGQNVVWMGEAAGAVVKVGDPVTPNPVRRAI